MSEIISFFNSLPKELISILYIPFGAFVWRLRGGAWPTLFGLFTNNTTLTRIVTGILMAFPMFLLTANVWFYSALASSIFLSLSFLGWGPYISVGTNSVSFNPAKSSWLDFFPKLFGAKQFSIEWDIIGLIACGLIMFTMNVLTFGILSLTTWMIPIIIGASIVFSCIYWLFFRINVKKLPAILNFAVLQGEWAEVVVGVWIAIIFLITLSVVQ